MLNHIDDDAAVDALKFYQSMLKKEIRVDATFNAHYNIGLLLWRNFGQESIGEMITSFSHAAVSALDLLDSLNDDTNIFDYMTPMFVVYIFGSHSDRVRLTAITNAALETYSGKNFKSFVNLLLGIKATAVSRDWDDKIIETIQRANNCADAHPFYRPWINEFVNGLMAIKKNKPDDLERACTELDDFHEEEALYASLKNDVQGLMCFWTLALKVVSESNGTMFKLMSPYVPMFDPL